MTQPPSPSAAALEAVDAWCKAPDCSLAHLLDAFAAQAVAAERAKPTASDHEAAIEVMQEIDRIGYRYSQMSRIEFDGARQETVAAALAKRGEREHQFWTDLIAPHLKGRALNVSAFLRAAAAIRNQTLTGD